MPAQEEHHEKFPRVLPGMFRRRAAEIRSRPEGGSRRSGRLPPSSALDVRRGPRLAPRERAQRRVRARRPRGGQLRRANHSVRPGIIAAYSGMPPTCRSGLPRWTTPSGTARPGCWPTARWPGKPRSATCSSGFCSTRSITAGSFRATCDRWARRCPRFTVPRPTIRGCDR